MGWFAVTATDQRPGVTVTHLWLGWAWLVALLLAWGLLYRHLFHTSVLMVVLVTVGVVYIAFFLSSLRLATIHWADGTSARLFAIKNWCDFAREDFDVLLLPHRGAALLRHSIDPLHQVILLLPAPPRRFSLWPDLFAQAIGGCGVRLVALERDEGRRLLARQLGAIAPEAHPDWERELDRFLARALGPSAIAFGRRPYSMTSPTAGSPTE